MKRQVRASFPRFPFFVSVSRLGVIRAGMTGVFSLFFKILARVFLFFSFARQNFTLSLSNKPFFKVLPPGFLPSRSTHASSTLILFVAPSSRKILALSVSRFRFPFRFYPRFSKNGLRIDVFKNVGGHRRR